MEKADIYLDNAGSTRCYREAAQIYTDIATGEYGNPSAIHLKGVRAEEVLENAREDIAESLKCKPKELIFTSGGTESNNLAIMGACKANARGGRHILTSEIEHSSVYYPILTLEKEGYEVTRIPSDSGGVVRLDMIGDAITEETVLVSIMHVNNETGVIQPVEEIGNIIRKKSDKCIFHVDGVQSLGKLPIIPSRTHIDMLSGSGHKFHGPKGCGFLYKKDNIRISPLVYGGGQEKGLRSGTENAPAISAMAYSLGRTLKQNQELSGEFLSLKEGFANSLSELEGVHINGYRDPLHSAWHILNVRFDGVRSEVMVHALEEYGIYASTGSACSSHSKSSSRTLLSMGLSKEEADSSVRFSFSQETTREQLDIVTDRIAQLLPVLRKFKRM